MNSNVGKINPMVRPKAPPQMYNNFVAPERRDDGYANDLSSIFATSTYAQITDKLNGSFNLNIRNQNGENLAFAIINNANEEITEAQRLDVIKRLEEKGTPICSINNNNQTIAHVAGKKGYFDIVAYVATKSCGIDIVDNYGNAPIHYCVDKLVFDCGKDKVFEEESKMQREIASESDISVIAKELIYKQIREMIRVNPHLETHFTDIYKYVKLNKLFRIDDIEKIIDKRRKEYVDYRIGHRDTFKLDEATLKELTNLYEDVKVKDSVDIDENFVAQERNKNEKEKNDIISRIIKIHDSLKKNAYDKLPKLQYSGVPETVEDYCDSYYKGVSLAIFNKFNSDIAPTVSKIVDVDAKNAMDFILNNIKYSIKTNDVNAIYSIYRDFNGRKLNTESLKNLNVAKSNIDTFLKPDGAKKLFELDFAFVTDKLVNVPEKVKNDIIGEKDDIIYYIEDFLYANLNDAKYVITQILKTNRINNPLNDEIQKDFNTIIERYWDSRQNIKQMDANNVDKNAIITYFNQQFDIIQRNIADTVVLKTTQNDINRRYPNNGEIFNNYYVANFTNAIYIIIGTNKLLDILSVSDFAKIATVMTVLNAYVNKKEQLKKLRIIQLPPDYLHFQFEKYILQMRLYLGYDEEFEACYNIVSIINNIICIQRYLLDNSKSHLQVLSIAINIYQYAIEAIMYLVKQNKLQHNFGIKYEDVYTNIVDTLKQVEKYVEICNKQTSCDYFNNYEIPKPNEELNMYFNIIRFNTYSILDKSFSEFYAKNNTQFNRTLATTDFRVYDFDINISPQYLTYFYQKDFNHFFGYTEARFNYTKTFDLIDILYKIRVDNKTYFTGYIMGDGLETKFVENNTIFKDSFKNKIGELGKNSNEYQIIQSKDAYGINVYSYPIVSMHYVGEIIKQTYAKLYSTINTDLTIKQDYTDTDTKHYIDINKYMEMVATNAQIKETIVKSTLTFILNQSISQMINHECLYLIQQVRNEPTTNADYIKIIEDMQKMYFKRYFYNEKAKLLYAQANPAFKRNNPFNKLPSTDPIHKITATQCTNNTLIEKFNNIKFNYSILDKNGNNVLNHLIAQYNVDGVNKINGKIWEIKNVTNNQGLNSIGFLDNMVKQLENVWSQSARDGRFSSYADTLNNVIKNNSQFANMQSMENEPFVQNMINGCFLFIFNGESYTLFNTPIISITIYKNLDEQVKKNIKSTDFTLYYSEPKTTACKQFVDYDRYEDSSYNGLNYYFIEAIYKVIINTMAVEFGESIRSYFEKDIRPDIYDDFAEILKQSIYIKLNIQNPNKSYPSVDILKEKLLAKIYEQTGFPKNADDDNVMNTLMNYYIFLSDNIAFDFYAEANNFVNDSIKLSALTEIKNIINNAPNNTGKSTASVGKLIGHLPSHP